METEKLSFGRQWVFPIALLTTSALLLFWAFYLYDFYSASAVAGEQNTPVGRYVGKLDPDTIPDAVSQLGGMLAAVFGIVITVVSIIVQLSAERYTGVARMFLNDRVNLGVMAFYVIATVTGVWTSLSIQSQFVPRATLVMMIALTTSGLVVMAPYFGYVFWFLEPGNIIARIRRDAVKVAHAGAVEDDSHSSGRAQVETLNAMEELTDITSNSISGKDKIIASRAVDALKDFALAYIDRKATATDMWFEIGGGLKQNPDFVAMAPESLHDLEERRTWVEWKVMRQYLGIYNEALGMMRDINYLIAIDTRYIGEAAGKHDDDELMELVFRFMNSYMRATLNAKDVRTAYNVLNQYRLLVESMLRQGHNRAAVAGVKHMNYYGHVSFDMKLTFVTETVAYDVSTLVEIAHQLGADAEPEMLEDFLELDRPLRVRSQEKALLGVRKAQVKLACYYLMNGEADKARVIADDMKGEPRDRLVTIRDQLARVETKDFWEIIDRGRNFEYMPPEQRKQMDPFFEWLGLGDVPESTAAPSELAQGR